MKTKEYHQLVTDYQSNLYAFICSLLGGSKDARDVLQETNLVLWRKAEDYDLSGEFKPWAFKIAYIQVLAYRRRQQRERVVFDDALLNAIAEQFSDNIDSRLSALDKCVERLPDSHRKLVKRHYDEGQSVASIGVAIGRTANSVAASLYRIRKTLSACVERSVRLESSR